MLGAGVRVVLAFAMLAVLLTAQLGRHDDWFPLGMLGQYAHPRDPDGSVVNTSAEVRLAQGSWAPVTLTAAASGITRVELEQTLPTLVEDPDGLARLAAAYEERHPAADVVEVRVRQHVTSFADGARSGGPQVVDIVSWSVP